MSHISLELQSVRKEFNRRVIFRDISFLLRDGQSLAITGKNGSGKSTLVKIICGLLTPSGGSVKLAVGSKDVDHEDFFQHIGFVSPYVNLYEEFTAMENLLMIGRIRRLRGDTGTRAEDLLKEFNIHDRRNDEVRTYSSGMKQRLKYAVALLHEPEILILDEPTSNLDEEGTATVRGLMKEYRKSRTLIIATNERDDAQFANMRIRLGEEGGRHPLEFG